MLYLTNKPKLTRNNVIMCVRPKHQTCQIEYTQRPLSLRFDPRSNTKFLFKSLCLEPHFTQRLPAYPTSSYVKRASRCLACASGSICHSSLAQASTRIATFFFFLVTCFHALALSWSSLNTINFPRGSFSLPFAIKRTLFNKTEQDKTCKFSM